jgi:hypothetical protein
MFQAIVLPIGISLFLAALGIWMELDPIIGVRADGMTHIPVIFKANHERPLTGRGPARAGRGARPLTPQAIL